MNMNWRTGFLVAIWFLVGVIIFAITKDWQIVAAIGTWLLAGGLIFAILQVRQMGKNTNAQVAVGLFEGLREKDAKDTLRKIYRLRPEQIECLPISTIESDIELRNEIDNVTDWLDLLGALVAKGIVNNELAIEGFSGVTVLRCWYQLGESYMREVRNQRGLYCEYLEDFARRSLDYFRDANIQVLFSREGETDKKDLVTELQEKDFHPRTLREIKKGRKEKKAEEDKSNLETNSSGEV